MEACTLLFLFVCLTLLQLHMHEALSMLGKDPTHGFTSLPLNSSNFDIQRPYDLAVSERYSFINGIHKLWVLSADKPLSITSHTLPRTEIRIKFEGHAYVPSGTSGVCIMQVFGSSKRATTLMLRVYNGALMYYRSLLIADDIYGRWFRVNVIHDTGAGLVRVYIDGDLRLVANDTGGPSHYFKCGVYTQNNCSYFMESRWKGIKVLKLSD
ncbi:citrate-binding protein-like [Asparagus officinalis]|uniref:citrate-binding protein-like n=1 Tax=Asparagus officinalis TaxID=4686 RepID=UPI00098E2791|nr:citrate-binding protein-like [Asparagus officinalis]